MLPNTECDSTHNMTELSLFSAVTSGFLFIFTVPLNGIILICLLRDISSNKAKYKVFFYKIIVNITIADLCKGLFADTSAIVWHVREATGNGHLYKDIDVPFVHVSLFITDGVALVSMTMLSLERILALLKPHVQFKKLTQILILASSWPLSVCILLPYQVVGFLTELVIFLACTNSIAIVSLLLLTSIYRYRFRAPYSRSISLSKLGSSISSITNLESSINETTTTSAAAANESPPPTAISSNVISSLKTKMTRTWSAPNIKTAKRKTLAPALPLPHPESSTLPRKHGRNGSETADANQNLSKADPHDIHIIERSSMSLSNQNSKLKRKRSISLGNIDALALNQPFQRTYSSSSSIRAKQGKRERRVTVTFLKMLLVFVFTYLPTLCMVIFLNLRFVDCHTKHILRDLSVLAILSSSLFRAINFLATLKHTRQSVKKMLSMKTGKRRKTSK